MKKITTWSICRGWYPIPSGREVTNMLVTAVTGQAWWRLAVTSTQAIGGNFTHYLVGILMLSVAGKEHK